MLRIELKAVRPGYAEFSATNWKGGAENIEISVQRSQDSYYFAEGQNWNIEPVWLKVNEQLSLQDGVLSGVLGPWLIDALVQQSTTMQYRMMVRDAETKDMGVLKLSNDVLASSASGNTERGDDVRSVDNQILTEIPDPEPEPIIEPIEEIEVPLEEEIVIEPEAVVEEPEIIVPSQPEPKKKSKLGLIILLVLLLAIAGAAAYFFLNKDKAEEKPQPADECSLSQNKNDELAFIQSCLKTKPDSQRILALINQAKAENKCAIAQRLYANQAQGGNAEIALAYAKEYEENANSSCFKADKGTAIYWYETALEANPNLAEAKQRLAELKK
ncbi:hypothetical protein [Aggregatibacter kilianii]|uniref:hypothetical protein n=1 Tax=Aggregatibacter kilianii TaxID=2025884 RepID=UPI000D65AFC8|nr:hypothetical protein [Aggregatibacter kilianii]